MNIYQKLVEVRKEVSYLKKENSGAQYSYVSSSQVLANVRSKMDELNLLLIPAVTGHNVNESAIEYKDANGNPTKRTTTYFTELDMTMTWVNADNPEEKIVSPWYGQGVDIAGEKGVGKALTYAEKYFMLKFFNIATDKDDPDAFQKKHDDEPKQPKQQPTGQRQQPQQQGNGQKLVCTAEGCTRNITKGVYDASVKEFKKPLCMPCQDKARKLITSAKKLENQLKSEQSKLEYDAIKG